MTNITAIDSAPTVDAPTSLPSLDITPNSGQFPRMLAALRNWIAGRDHSAPPSLRSLFVSNGGELGEGERVKLDDAQKKEIRPLQKAAMRAHSTYVSANKARLLRAFHSIDRSGGLLRARETRDAKTGAVKSISLAARKVGKVKAK